jgi:hypothetical protein
MLNFILKILDAMSWKVIIAIAIAIILFGVIMLASVKVEVHQEPEEWRPDQPRPRNVNYEYVVYL